MNGRDPLVTVIVPTIGRLDYLADTRRSVAGQVLDDFELLILDNASPQAAVDAFAVWAREDDRLRVMRCTSRLPMFSNFNRGIRAARGKYVAFIHDDDVYDPNYLKVAVGALERHSTAAFCGSNYDFIDESGHVTERRRWIGESGLVSGNAYIRRMLSGARSFIPTPGLVFRRSAIEHGFDDDLSLHFGDYVWLMRIAEQNDVMLVTDTLVRIRRHGEQASRSMGMSVAIPQRTRTLLDYCDEYEKRHPEATAFIRKMRRRILVVHRVALTWGWAMAVEESEARACIGALGDTAIDRGLGSMLGAIGATPLRGAVQRGRDVMRRFTGHIAF